MEDTGTQRRALVRLLAGRGTAGQSTSQPGYHRLGALPCGAVLTLASGIKHQDGGPGQHHGPGAR